MFEATHPCSRPGRSVAVAASYVSFLKPICKLDSTVRVGAPQGVQVRGTATVIVPDIEEEKAA